MNAYSTCFHTARGAAARECPIEWVHCVPDNVVVSFTKLKGQKLHSRKGLRMLVADGQVDS